MRATAAVKNSFVAGLVLVAPLVITLLVLRIAVNWVLGLVGPIARGTRLARYTANDELGAQLLAAILIVAAITSLGYVAQWRVGKLAFGRFGRVANFIPLVGTIYSSVRQVANALVERDNRYESVVLVEYPIEGTYVVGFVTNESPAPVRAVAGDPAYNVFLPNSPNPTGGQLLLVPEDRVHEIDMSVRRGIRLLVTTGMAVDEPDLPGIDEGDATTV